MSNKGIFRPTKWPSYAYFKIFVIVNSNIRTFANFEGCDFEYFVNQSAKKLEHL